MQAAWLAPEIVLAAVVLPAGLSGRTTINDAKKTMDAPVRPILFSSAFVTRMLIGRLDFRQQG